jgi:hypothetical protein
MAFRAKMTLVLMEVRRILSTSSVSADSFRYQGGMEGSWPYDFSKQLPGVFPSLPSPFDAQETQFLASTLLGLQREVT